MKTKKSTKRALLASVIALLLCCSMLVGTTFAWFTDSVSSVNNVIVAGNLDVEVTTGDGIDIEEQATLFDEVVLWEPGVVAYENLTVANVGTLALKYQMSVNFTNATATPEGKTLADVLKVAVVKGGIPAETSREQLITDETLTWEGLESFAEYGKLLPVDDSHINGAELPADAVKGSQTYGIVLYWQPSDNDNDYNMNNGVTNILTIDLGVNLVATQLVAEDDSFGNDYDAAADWTGIIPESLEDTTLEIVPGDSAEDRGTITINSAEDLVYLNNLAAEWVSLYSNGQGTSSTNYSESNGGKGTDYYYHWRWTIELATDLDMSNIPMNSVDISYWNNFEGNGHTISNVVLKDGQDGLFNNGAKAINNLTVKNITVNAPEAETVGAVAGNGTMNNVHVENAAVIGGKYVGGICGKGSSFVNCSIKDSTVTGTNKTVGGLIGYSIGDPDAATVTGNTVENVTVTGAYNVGGLLGQSQNEKVENNTVKDITVISTSEKPADASANEVRTAEVVARSDFSNTTIGTNTAENVTLQDK